MPKQASNNVGNVETGQEAQIYIHADQDGYYAILEARTKKEAMHETTEKLKEWGEGEPYFTDSDKIYPIPADTQNLEDGDHVTDIDMPEEYLEDNEICLPDVINPDEPTANHDHEWASHVEIDGGVESNPGVTGHSGGAIIRSHCKRPGCYVTKTKDTWASNPHNGIQGLETTTYGDMSEDKQDTHDELYGDDAE